MEPKKEPVNKQCRSIKFSTCGWKHIGVPAFSLVQIGPLRAPLFSKAQSCILDIQPGTNTMIVECSGLPMELVQGHAGCHYQCVRALVEGSRKKFFPVAKMIHDHVTSDRDEHDENDDSTLNIVLLDANGSDQSVAAAALLSKLFVIKGHRVLHTHHMHRGLWPCRGTCDECNKQKIGSLAFVALERSVGALKFGLADAC